MEFTRNVDHKVLRRLWILKQDKIIQKTVEDNPDRRYKKKHQ